MKMLLVAISVFFSSMAYANPEVTRNTDIGKRKVVSHNQVTRCEGGECSINTVTRFDQVRPGSQSFWGECFYVEEGGKRFSYCLTTPKPKKAVVRVKTVTVTKKVKVYKKNRLQLHLGYGPTGLEQKSNNNKTKVSEDMDVVMGGTYSRAINSQYSIGATMFTNKTTTLSLGFDY